MHRGAVAGIYRKCHPAIRRSVYRAGEERPVFRIGGLTFGILICYDSTFPDLARDMVAQGAAVLFIPANNGLPPARADVTASTRETDVALMMNAPHRSLGVLLATLNLVAVMSAGPLVAQSTIRTPGMVYVSSGHERWIYPGQRPDRAGWRSLAMDAIRLDSITVPGTDAARIFHNHAALSASNTWSRAWRGPTGTIDSITAHVEMTRGRAMASYAESGTASQPPSMDETMAVGSAMQFAQYTLLFLGAVPGDAPTPLHIALRLSDHAWRMDGEMHSRSLGDTVIDGRSLRIIRDSARVVVDTEHPTWESTLFAVRTDVRRVTGTIVAWRLYDPVRDLTIAASDTTRLSGSEYRHYPEGRTSTGTVHYERQRTVTLLDSAGLMARREAATGPAGIGMVRRPELGDRILDVSIPHIRDSLLHVHANTAHQPTRDSIEQRYDLLMRPGTRERLARTYIAEADTASALRLIRFDTGDPLTEWTYRLIRPVLDDPALAMRFGVSTNTWYETFGNTLRLRPVALAPDSTTAWCAPAVCRLVAEEWTGANEPRLRNIGLMMRYAMDPARWADTLIRVADAGVHQLQLMSRLARGVVIFRPGEPDVPIPAADADWTVWLPWLRGASDATLRRRDSLDAATRRPRLPPQRTVLSIDLWAGRERDIRMASLRFGTSYADSLIARFRHAEPDTARFVYGTLLAMLNVALREPAAIHEAMRSASALDRALAMHDLKRLSYEPADSGTAAVIERTLFDYLLQGEPIWPRFEPPGPPFSGSRRLPLDPASAHIVSDRLTTPSLERLRRAGIPVHPGPWRLPDSASGRVVRVDGIVMAGPFAFVTMTDAVLVRLPDGRGGGDASRTGFWLVLIDGRWLLVDLTGWVT